MSSALSRAARPGAAFALPRTMLTQIEVRAPLADQQGDLSQDLDDLRSAGAIAAPLPCDRGGVGLGTCPGGWTTCFEVLRSLGRANLSLARLYEGHVNAVKIVALYGEAPLRARIFQDVAAGGLLGVWGADGSPPLTLTRHGDALTLHGVKRFASGLGLVTTALVTATMPDGPQLVAVPVTDPGRADPHAWTMAGMRATRSGLYRFDALALPVCSLVGKPGDYLREPHFEGGVWRYCAAHLGGAEALYQAMLGRLTTSGRAGDPHQERRIAEAGIACETARLWICAAAQRVEAGGGNPQNAAAYALLAREATETACLTVLDRVERALGMAAHDRNDPIERIRRDLSLFLRQAAPDAKRAAAARALVESRTTAEHL